MDSHPEITRQVKAIVAAAVQDTNELAHQLNIQAEQRVKNEMLLLRHRLQDHLESGQPLSLCQMQGSF